MAKGKLKFQVFNSDGEEEWTASFDEPDHMNFPEEWRMRPEDGDRFHVLVINGEVVAVQKSMDYEEGPVGNDGRRSGGAEPVQVLEDVAAVLDKCGIDHDIEHQIAVQEGNAVIDGPAYVYNDGSVVYTLNHEATVDAKEFAS